MSMEDEVRKLFGDLNLGGTIQVSKLMETMVKSLEINTLKKLRSEIDKRIKTLQAQAQTSSMDPYVILGVKPDATQEEVKSAYAKRSFEVHPDRNPDKLKWAHEEMMKVNAAYEAIRRMKGW